jgi:ABC-type transport system involved in multi-copper enzyme maturation permease subunit
MIGTIAKREFLESLKSAKFLIGLLITLAIAAGSTVINVQDYASRHQNYLDAQKELKSNNFQVNVFREPHVLSALVRGKDRDLGDMAKISVMDAPSRLTGYMDEKKPKFPSLIRFSAVDFAFLVRVVMSLLVIFLAYNSISEEKANGTLKLAMANALPRDTFLLGKLLSGLAAVIGSLAIAATLVLIIMAVHPLISLTGAEAVRIVAIMGASALYLAVFYALGVFISVKTDRPAVSLMVLLQAWIFIVIIYPNLSVIVAENVRPLPSEETLLQQRSAIYQKYKPDIDRANAGLNKPDRTRDDLYRFNEAWSKVSTDNAKLDQDFSRRQTQQMKTAELLSILSPAALYDQVVNRLSRTDVREYDRFMESVGRMREKHVERSLLSSKDPEAAKKIPRPELETIPDSPGEALASLWPQGVLLAFMTLVFFALAYTSFLRKDLR